MNKNSDGSEHSRQQIVTSWQPSLLQAGTKGFNLSLSLNFRGNRALSSDKRYKIEWHSLFFCLPHKKVFSIKTGTRTQAQLIRIWFH